MEEQFNKEAKEGWRFAADAARITDERAGIEDQKAHIRRCFCSDRQQLGSSCLRKGRSSYNNPRKRRKKCPGVGTCAWRDANVCSIILAHAGMDPKK